MKRKKSSKKNPINLLFSFVVVFLIFFLGVSNFRIYQRRSDLKDQIEAKRQEASLLSERIEGLREAEGRAVDEEYLMEKIAREQLLLRRKGEEVIFITFPEADDSAAEEDLPQESYLWWNPFTWKFK